MNERSATPPLARPRPFLDALQAYVPGEQPGAGFIKLNTNEFPYPAAPEVLEAIRREASDLVRVYPNPTCEPLRAALARRHGVEPDQVLVGNGSDEVLRLLAHAWLDRDRTLSIVEPTYTLYEVLAAQFEGRVHVHPLEGQTGLPESLFRGGWDLCLLPVPNPPLGTVFPEADLRRLMQMAGLVVLDAAYADFADHCDFIPWIAQAPNLVVTRTFSKSHGLAGMRVGYAVGPRRVIEDLHKLRDSYNVNRISQAAALGALAADAYYRTRAREIVESREGLSGELRALGFDVPPSRGNFVFARHPRAAEVFAALRARRILVRHFNRPGLQDGLRITIGTPEENAALLDALRAIRSDGLPV